MVRGLGSGSRFLEGKQLGDEEEGVVSRRKSSRGAILVVEDDPLVNEVLTQIVSRAGYSVIIAEDGLEGVRLFRKARGNVACIVLDFEIPGLHSSRALSEFKEIDKDVCVLLSSGYPKADIAKSFPLENVDGFIPKPFKPKHLISEINKITKKSCH